jgi:hypothetical protein
LVGRQKPGRWSVGDLAACCRVLVLRGSTAAWNGDVVRDIGKTSLDARGLRATGSYHSGFEIATLRRKYSDFAIRAFLSPPTRRQKVRQRQGPIGESLCQGELRRRASYASSRLIRVCHRQCVASRRRNRESVVVTVLQGTGGGGVVARPNMAPVSTIRYVVPSTNPPPFTINWQERFETQGCVLLSSTACTVLSVGGGS